MMSSNTYLTRLTYFSCPDKLSQISINSCQREKRQFEHRVATFIASKKFVGRQDLEVTERMKVLIAAMGCMLSFGRRNYDYGLIEFILVFPGEFYSAMNEAYHKGEFIPRERTLVLGPTMKTPTRIRDELLRSPRRRRSCPRR